MFFGAVSSNPKKEKKTSVFDKTIDFNYLQHTEQYVLQLEKSELITSHNLKIIIHKRNIYFTIQQHIFYN